MRTIPVTTASAAYRVVLGPGLLAGLYPRLRPLLAGGRRLIVLTSPQIWALWSRRFLASFPAGTAPPVLFLPPGERFKRLAAIESLAGQMHELGADRRTLLLAFGGGILGDAGGFLASIYMRGIDYVQMPTTLLAQVDSSVGGKTGVNLAHGKNLLGSFHHPLAVFADTDTLATLPERELRAGLFEIIKAGLIRDAKLFTRLEQGGNILADVPALASVIAASVRIKAAIVSEDEREHGPRMLLNFGHTLGHAIEASTNYRTLLHGEAVAWGMLAAIHLSAARGLLSPLEAERARSLIERYGPLPGFRATPQKLLTATAGDKKNHCGVRRFILLESLGRAAVAQDVTDRELLDAAGHITRLIARAGKPRS